MSNLVAHARRELDLIGEDEDTTAGLINVVQAFADMGHSGGSAHFAANAINQLLRYQPLSALTNDPTEWTHHNQAVWGEPGGIWQSNRNPEAFSTDAGATYYLLSERRIASEDDDRTTAPLHTSATR